MSRQLLIGTSKGLVIYKENGSKKWSIDRTDFVGFPISMIFVDERTNTWWVGLAHRHWGQKLHFSIDQGKSWQSVPMPKYPKEAEVKVGQRAKLKKIWCMAHAGADKPGELWLGTEPGGLFHSSNNGQSFELVEALWNHPSRIDENQWFGAGRDYPFIHTIAVDPRDSNHVYIAVSCAGVFETKDGGKSWAPRNHGLIATYLPNQQAEVGHDPHAMIICKSNPDVIWQQNHCGIFRTTDAGQNWENITDKNKVAHYGFALAIDHNDPDTAWVIPATSDEERVAHNLALCVCRTKNGGQEWKQLRNGLPQNHCFDIVFRHSMTNDGQELFFGSTTGNLYHSTDGGDHWHLLSTHLARVDYLALVSR